MSGTQVPLPDGTFAFFPEGTSEAQMAAGMRQLLAQMPKPPPGVIIHEPTRSYVTGAQGEPTLSVDTSGMQPGTMSKSKDFNLSDFIVNTVGSLAGGGQADPRLPDRNTAAAALALRRDSTPFSIAARPAPFVQGLSVGYGDEALSAAAGAGQALRGGSFADMYGTMQEAQRQELAQDRAEHPVLAPVLQAGGALANMAALMRAGVPLGASAKAPLGARMLGGAGMGAGYGAAEGFGSGSGLEDRLKQAALGAGTGFAVGGAIPAAAAAVGSLANRAFDAYGVTPYLRQLGVGRPAGDAVNRVLEADDAFTGAGRQNITAAGPGGMLADAGASTQGLLDMVIQRLGGGSRLARDAVEQRGTAANQTLTDALDTALGQPRGIQTMITDIRQAGQPARSSAYDTAYGTPIDYSHPDARRLESLLGRLGDEGGNPDAVVREANRLMRISGDPPSAQIRATVNPDGTIAYDRLPDVRQIDYITRGLRKIAQEEETKGIMGGPSETGQAYRNLAGDIRGTTRSLVPEYGTALDTAADDIGRIEATRLGNDLLSPSMTRDEAAQALRRHSNSAAEMDAVRLGVRQSIDDQMANVRRIATDPNLDARQAAAALKDLSSDAANAKLDMILDPLQRQQLTNQIQEVERAIQLRANMTANSKTFGRTAQQEAVKQLSDTAPEVLRRGEPLNFARRAWQTFTGGTPQAVLGREDVINQQIAELLTTARGQNAQQQLGLLQQAYTAAPRNVQTAQNIGAGAGLLAGVPAYGYGKNLLEGFARGMGLLGGGP